VKSVVSAHFCSCSKKFLSHNLDFQPLSQGRGHSFKSRQLDIFRVVLYSRDCGLFGLESAREFFLRHSGCFAGFPKYHPNLELLVSFVVSLGKFCVAFSSLINLFLQITHDLLPSFSESLF
jgi:hypothetical protein